MKCLKCGHDNNATVAYCQKCGFRLDMTADQIREALVQEAQGERAMNTQYYARQALFFAIILFVVALTVLIVSTGAQTESYAVPSFTSGTGPGGANSTEVTFNVKDRVRLEKAMVPFSSKRR